MKTLAIRLDDEVHARLAILAKLADISVTEAIRLGIEKQIAEMAADTTLSAKAEGLRAAIEQDAREQAEAIADLFGTTPPAPSGKTGPASSTRKTPS